MSIAQRQTIQAFRQRVYAALTSPPLAYSINGAAPVDLPSTSVIPRWLWEIGQTAPMPLVAFAVEGRGDPSIVLGSATGIRSLRLKIWTVSGNGIDEVTSIYEAVRAVLNYADQDAPPGVTDLSRAGTGGSDQPLTVQLCREIDVHDPAYEIETKRWYLSAEYDVVAL